MAKCVVHLKKIPGMGLGGVRNHMDRTGVSRTNPDIVKEKSGQNYVVSGFSDASHLERRINARIKELSLKRAVRRDAVRLVDVVITSSRDGIAAMGEKEAAFFRDAAEFLAKRFGRENVMYANVHKDEAVPHLHLGFVPVTADGRLAAKSILTQKSLRDLQTRFWREVGQKYGLERGEQTVTPKEHIETERHKAEHAKNEATRAQEKATRAKEEATQAEKTAREEEERADAARTINQEKAALVKKSTDARKRVEAIQAKKVGGGLFGRPYYKMSAADYDELREIAARGADAVEEHLAMQRAVEEAQAAAESAKRSAESARNGQIHAEGKQKEAEERAAAIEKEKEQELEAMKKVAAPILGAPMGKGRELALQGIEMARRQFRAVYDTVARHVAWVVCRGEEPKKAANYFSEPMKELGIDQPRWFAKKAGEAMYNQLMKHKFPKEAVGAGWTVHPNAIDYKASDAPLSIIKDVLSPKAVATLHMDDDSDNENERDIDALDKYFDKGNQR